MRTTLDIDEDVLNAAKALARQQHQSAGQVVSQLLRDALTGRANRLAEGGKAVVGFRPFASGANIVTNDQVNALREQEGV
ncbi:MAG: DUF6364 family protein [Rhodocyclaceae bacterium]|jgi:hypothetical protein|uniref:DUF6364 family protein n=1 Tax=Sulfuricystis thermophila TaxID=2496847 RepID=UPI001036723A|nr:DUF6364 family protein [Sulfuricystis thermophila]MDI6748798.1 DUF6364 family protein [Rhodocyclaceae bacterium]